MSKLMEECKAVLASFPEIELAYWFGSRAQGKGTPRGGYKLVNRTKVERQLQNH